MNSMCNGSAHALLQQVVAPEMQGRVFTLVMSLCNAATPLGMAVGGPFADAVGVRTLYVMGGAVAILLGAGGFFVPAIVHLEDGSRSGHTAAQGVTMPSAPGPVRAAVVQRPDQ